MPGLSRRTLAFGVGCLGCGGFLVSLLLLGAIIAAIAPAAPIATRAPTVVAVVAPTIAATAQPTIAPPTALPTSPPTAPATELATATIAPTAPPKPEPLTPSPTGAPVPIAVPAYDWISIAMTSLPARPRFRVDVVVAPSYDDDQMLAVLRDAVNRAFRERPTAKAVVIFAYSSRAATQQGGGADKGKAQASSDKLGWTGDGKFDAERDEGKVYVSLGSFMTGQRNLTVDRQAR